MRDSSADAGLAGELMLELTSCPECGVPAEITERFRLPSTDGPVDHVVVRCAADHFFRMAEDMLGRQATTAADQHEWLRNRL